MHQIRDERGRVAVQAMPGNCHRGIVMLVTDGLGGRRPVQREISIEHARELSLYLAAACDRAEQGTATA